MSSNDPFILEADRASVRRLALNRPNQRNPLSDAMMLAIQAALDRAIADDAVRVIILTGQGPAFSAGHDLKEMRQHKTDPDQGAAFFAQLFDRCGRLMRSIVASPKPVIAEVRGVATAAGCQLVASCDLAIAEPQARFATPGVNIGLFCSTPMVALTRAVPRKAAMEMLLLGDMVDAERAREIGLINRIVEADQLSAAVDDLARRIAEKSAHVVAIGKRLFQDQMDRDLAGAYAISAEAMTRNMLSDDAGEGIGAFLEKREPHWGDR